MKEKLLVLGFLIMNNCFGISWSELFDVHDTILPGDTVLPEQYRAYLSSSAPTLGDPRIKKIPIYENSEALVDLREITCERIGMMPDPSTPFEAPFFNSGFTSASKMRMGIFVKLQGMVEALDSLANNFGYEPGQISIKVFEGLRDLTTQKYLFQKQMEEILSARPELTLEEAEKEAAKWVSPVKNNVPAHSTGAAIDMRLWDNQKGDYLDMGAFGVIWGSNENAPTFSEKISDEQKNNRLYCLIAAEKAGLRNYPYEFWHFSSEDRVAVYWDSQDSNEKRASYGSIE